jgi:hypothetical protein
MVQSNRGLCGSAGGVHTYSAANEHRVLLLEKLEATAVVLALDASPTLDERADLPFEGCHDGNSTVC